jgi:hypothetical protein
VRWIIGSPVDLAAPVSCEVFEEEKEFLCLLVAAVVTAACVSGSGPARRAICTFYLYDTNDGYGTLVQRTAWRYEIGWGRAMWWHADGRIWCGDGKGDNVRVLL